MQFSHKYNDVPLTFQIPVKFKWGNVREVLIFQKDNKYFISVSYEPNKPEYKDNNQYQAIDLGITKIVTAVNSHGKFLEVETPRPDKYWILQSVNFKVDVTTAGNTVNGGIN